ncbi:DUF4142 domain-containing protein [Hansschlegelia sp.]|uniref:DUF4142 domain-containing protein n=1 Tax=Hansschlegelia sp. TaxID=2041892 RepID=UPI002CF2F16D|nr:DUF4142 domain-containing protein [Hansschlegelia sp.]HVI27641.1 DUF4142 domain-containing protein [Hansschlegelia sp.]
MNRRHALITATAAALAPLTFGTASARTAVGPAAIDSMKLPILAGGDFATMTSKLALSRARSSPVRAFAKLEIEEQAAVALAFGARSGTAGLTAKHAALLQELENAPASEFDALYVQGQIMGHRELLALHTSYANSGLDPVARGASIVAAPSIHTHLGMLQTLKRIG